MVGGRAEELGFGRAVEEVGGGGGLVITEGVVGFFVVNTGSNTIEQGMNNSGKITNHYSYIYTVRFSFI